MTYARALCIGVIDTLIDNAVALTCTQTREPREASIPLSPDYPTLPKHAQVQVCVPLPRAMLESPLIHRIVPQKS